MNVHQKYKHCKKPENKNKKECKEFILFYESIYVPTGQGEATFDYTFTRRPDDFIDDTQPPTPVPKPKPEPPSGPRPDPDDKPEPKPDTKTDVKPDDKSPVVTPPTGTVVLNHPILIDTFDTSELYKTLLGEFSQKELENIISDTEKRKAGMVDPFVQNYFRQTQLLKRYGVSPETLSVIHPIIGLLPFNRLSGSVLDYTPTPEPAPTAKGLAPTIRGATKKFKYLTPTRDDVEYTKAQDYNLKVLKNLKNEPSSALKIFRRAAGPRGRDLPLGDATDGVEMMKSDEYAFSAEAAEAKSLAKEIADATARRIGKMPARIDPAPSSGEAGPSGVTDKPPMSNPGETEMTEPSSGEIKDPAQGINDPAPDETTNVRTTNDPAPDEGTGPQTGDPDPDFQPGATTTTKALTLEQKFSNALKAYNSSNDADLKLPTKIRLSIIENSGGSQSAMESAIASRFTAMKKWYNTQIFKLSGELDKAYSDVLGNMVPLQTLNSEGATALTNLSKATTLADQAALQTTADLKKQALGDGLTIQRALETQYRTAYTNLTNMIARYNNTSFGVLMDSKQAPAALSEMQAADDTFFNKDITRSAFNINLGYESADDMIEYAVGQSNTLIEAEKVATKNNFDIGLAKFNKILGGDFKISNADLQRLLKNKVGATPDEMEKAIDDLYFNKVYALEKPVSDLSNDLSFTYTKLTQVQTSLSTAQQEVQTLLDKLQNGDIGDLTKAGMYADLQAKSATLTTELDQFKSLRTEFNTTWEQLKSSITTANTGIKAINPLARETQLQGLTRVQQNYKTTYDGDLRYLLNRSDLTSNNVPTEEKFNSDYDAAKGEIDPGDDDPTPGDDDPLLGDGTDTGTTDPAPDLTTERETVTSSQTAISDAKTQLTSSETSIDQKIATLETDMARLDNVDNPLFIESTETAIGEIRLQLSELGSALSQYKADLNSLNTLVSDFNSSPAKSTLISNGEIVADETAVSDTWKTASYAKYNAFNTTFKTRLNTWESTVMDEAVTEIGEDNYSSAQQLVNLRLSFNTANIAYNRELAKLNTLKRKITASTFKDLDTADQESLLARQNVLARSVEQLRLEKNARLLAWGTGVAARRDIMNAAEERINKATQDAGVDPAAYSTTVETEITNLDDAASEVATYDAASETSIEEEDPGAAARRALIISRTLGGAKFGSNLFRKTSSVFSGVEFANLFGRITHSGDVVEGEVSEVLASVIKGARFGARALSAGAMATASLSLKALGKIVGLSFKVLNPVLMLAGGVMPFVSAAMELNANKALYGDNLTYQLTNNTRDNKVMPFPPGAPQKYRDTGHDNYDNEETSGYLNYFSYYLNDTDKFQEYLSNDRPYYDAYWGPDFAAWDPKVRFVRTKEAMRPSSQYPTSVWAYNIFKIFYNTMQTRYNQELANGNTKEGAAQLAAMYGKYMINQAIETDRPLYISQTQSATTGNIQYSGAVAFSEQQTAKALALYSLNPYIYYDLDEGMLEFMGLPKEMYKNSKFMNDPLWQTTIEGNADYPTQLAQITTNHRQAIATATIDTYQKLISNVPDSEPATRAYLLYQLNLMKQSPDVKPYLTAKQLEIVSGTPTENQAFELQSTAFLSNYYFSINAAWSAQTDEFVNIEDFADDAELNLPSWFSFSGSPMVEGLTSMENDLLASTTTLMEQLGVYDYNLAVLGAEGGKSFPEDNIIRMKRFEASELPALLQEMQNVVNLNNAENYQSEYVEVNDVIKAYRDQYQLEGLGDNLNTAALATVMNKLELAIQNNKGVNFYSESYPDYTAIDGAMTLDLNDTQASHFLALYQADQQRWVGYNALALAALGLNPDLAGDNPETLDNIFLESVPQPVIDQSKVDMFTTMINARNDELTKLEGQPDIALGIADSLVDQYIAQQAPDVSLPSDVGPSIQGTDTSTTSTTSTTNTTTTTPADGQT